MYAVLCRAVKWSGIWQGPGHSGKESPATLVRGGACTMHDIAGRMLQSVGEVKTGCLAAEKRNPPVSGQEKEGFSGVREEPSVLLLDVPDAGETLVELGNLPPGIQNTLDARPGRMSLGVNVQTQLCARFAVAGAGLVLAAISHHDRDFMVVGVDAGFHNIS